MLGWSFAPKWIRTTVEFPLRGFQARSAKPSSKIATVSDALLVLLDSPPSVCWLTAARKALVAKVNENQFFSAPFVLTGNRIQPRLANVHQCTPMPRVGTPFSGPYERGVPVRDLDRVRDLTNLHVFEARLNLFRAVLLSQPCGHIFRVHHVFATA